MLVDLAQEPDWQPRARYDLCIAGGGVAGLTLAKALADSGLAILLLEAASPETAAAGQALYAGEMAGTPTFPTEVSRLRGLGGSSNHWGGWLRALDPWDFVARPDIADSGWPLAAGDLAPYLAPALALLGVAPPPPDGEALPEASGDLRRIELAFSRPPLRFGEALLPALRAAAGLDLALNATLLDCDYDAAGERIIAFVFRAGADPRPRRALARHYVLALGALENARLLLAWNRRQGDRLGNAGGMVGRCFMQHHRYRLGDIALLRPAPAGMSAADPTGLLAGALRFHAPSPAALRREGMANVRLYALPGACRPPVPVPALPGCALVALGHLAATAEQRPNRESRVLLADTTDALGLPRLRLDWRPLPQDGDTLRRAARLYGAFLARAGVTRFGLADWLRDPAAPLPPPDLGDSAALGAAGHHLGTTRMATTARDGVADAHGRVFGTGNLFLAGSGLFPTGGHAPPTLTLLQLTLRLAEALRRR